MCIDWSTHACICKTFDPGVSTLGSIIICAITMKYYVEENVSQRSCTTIQHVVKMLATISETLIFFFLGVVTVTIDHEWNWASILFTLLFAFVWRGLGKRFSCLYLEETSPSLAKPHPSPSLLFLLQGSWC